MALLRGGRSEADEWSRFQRPGEQRGDGHRSAMQECLQCRNAFNENQLVTHLRD